MDGLEATRRIMGTAGYQALVLAMTVNANGVGRLPEADISATYGLSLSNT
jgi:hypothetical protein